MTIGEKEAKDIYTEWVKAWVSFDKGINKGRNKQVCGDIFESIILGHIHPLLNGELKVKTGLISFGDSLGPQTDIIVYSGTGIYECPYSNTAIVDSKDVKLVMEAKSYIDASSFKSLKPQMDGLRKFCPQAKLCIVTGEWAISHKREEKLNLADYNVILCSKGKDPQYDCTGEMTELVNFLRTLN